ncbi:unnamed protein product [Ixodes pacificus]
MILTALLIGGKDQRITNDLYSDRITNFDRRCSPCAGRQKSVCYTARKASAYKMSTKAILNLPNHKDVEITTTKERV